MGKLIVIEGASDGVGKTTQFMHLEKYLINEGYDVVKHHFPSYGTPQGSFVEEYLKGNFGPIKEISPYFINSLYAIDRAVTWQKELKHAYEEDKIILLDRYTTSSLIYQCAPIENIEERKKFIDYVIDFEYDKLGIHRPDMVIFLTASLEAINKMRSLRKNNEGISNDIHERDSVFMNQVYYNANFIAQYLNWDIVNCEVNGSMRSIDDIQSEIQSLVERKLTLGRHK